VADTKYYLDYHFPLELVQAILDLIQGQQDPNNPTPQVDPAAREWFSQPRLPGVTQPSVYAFVVPGMNMNKVLADFGKPSAPDATSAFFGGLDPSIYDVIEVDYPKSVPFSVNVPLGIANLIAAINANPGQFVLVGEDQGAVICSAVYDEIRYGSLTHRRSDFLGATMYGNPDREQGKIAPGTPDPGGHGIAPPSERLVQTEPLWWEFAQPHDPACTVTDSLTGQWQTTIYEAMVGNYTNDLQMIFGLFFDFPSYAPALANAIFDGMWFNYPQSNHDYSNYLPVGATKTVTQLGIDYLNQVGLNQRVTLDTNTVECITTTFKLPLSISELTMDILRMPCVVEAWYQDRSNNWRQCLDMQRSPIRINVARSDVKSYYKYTTRVYPIVAKQFQLRLTRTNDPAMTGVPYVVGLRNVLIRRNVYNRSQGTSYFEDEMDALGNVLSKYIKDWDAPRAADDDPTTYWKSEPMPDPAAVVSLYLDVRNDAGVAQTVDKVYIDPVYTGQNLNLYYTSDDYVGVRKLSPITINPDEDENTSWSLGAGRTDTSTGSDDSYYRWSFSIGPQVSQASWIGIEWTPGFAPTAGPPQNPILYRSIVPDGNAVGTWHPSIYYDVGAGEIVLEFNDGTSAPRLYTCPINPLWAGGDTLRIVVGWKYGPDTVYLSVIDQRGDQIANLTGSPTDLPRQVSYDGQHEIFGFKGLMTALILKLEDYAASSIGFQNSPTYYCDPDPVIPDNAGNVPATTLDNAVYAVAWTAQENGSGGPDDSHFEDKEWTPIWRDYIVTKGLLYFPQPIPLKYLKLEFSNLTEEAYPIYESGIEVQYKVFPISVTQRSTSGTQTYSSDGGFLGLGNFISVNGVRSVNWLDPNSVLAAVGSVFSPQIPPVVINAGTPFVTDTLPNMATTSIRDTQRTEMGSSYVSRRETLQPYILAQNAYTTTIKAEGLQAISAFTDVPWTDIAAANPGAITRVRSIGALPVQGTDWWIFPGQQLKIPASVMTKLTDTSTVTDRKMTTERRVRFNTTSVHRYDTKTLRRDAAMAYFAGVREVTPYTTIYIDGEDPVSFDFAHYDADQWTQDPGIIQLDSGPVSTATPVPTDDAHAVTDVGATMFKSFSTASTFSKVAVDFRDSGTIRSDSMWADIAPDSQSIGDTVLAPYVSTIPDTIPGGFWGDTIKDWSDTQTAWGEPYQVVSINIDGNRRYQGNRVLHFYRAAGAGQAGIKITQQTNFIAEGLFRIGCVLYKTTANANQVTLRLRRVSDGVVIHEEDVDVPVGRWYAYTSKFIAIPNSTDQVYTVEITLSGDAADDLYLSDLYTDIALIRYFVRLGAVGAYLHEVTDLRYVNGTAYVTTTEPVTDMSVTVEILSPKAWAFGATITPTYLK
jgi:hypothetical protein